MGALVVETLAAVILAVSEVEDIFPFCFVWIISSL